MTHAREHVRARFPLGGANRSRIGLRSVQSRTDARRSERLRSP